MAAPVSEVLTDAGPCGWCTHPQWSHKRGKSGCKELDCPCGKYEQPKTRPAQAVEEAVVAAALGEVHVLPVDEPTPAGPVPVEPASPVDPVEVVDVVKRRRRTPEPLPGGDPVPDPAVQAEHAEQVAAIDEQLAQAEPDDDQPGRGRRRPHDPLCVADIDRLTRALATQIEETQEVATELAEARTELAQVTRERDEQRQRTRDAEHAAKTAREAVVDLRRALAEQQKNTVDVPQLRADLEQAIADRQRVQQQYDDAVRNGLAAALRVLWQYPARQCLTAGCGFRTTVPYLDHEHPLTAVSVIVAERDPAEATASAVPSSKEQ
ncbi:hypothetical protein [Micromonospora aurantiaca (nom. illeg.)]|uniref:hypothetical protein n=1 Tax=Micromonospora aurantiaca (nom. illeg.) TaxID=47850 RepID=UPI003435802C